MELRIKLISRALLRWLSVSGVFILPSAADLHKRVDAKSGIQQFALISVGVLLIWSMEQLLHY